jgi:methyl-accepting chemotaxis protein WspA
MKNSLNIKQKVWLSLSLMILGYFISMVFGFIYGRRTESRLYDVSEYVFPAGRQSQVALTAFNQGMKLYEDAVILSDSSLAEDAREKIGEARTALQTIIELQGFPSQKKAQIQETLNHLNDFAASAHSVYVEMSNSLGAFEDEKINNGEGQTLEEKASALNTASLNIRDKLVFFSQTLADDLRAELKAISGNTRNQRYVNMIIFWLVVSVTTILVSIIITRSVISPINRALTFSDAIAKGDFTARISINQRDELGKLLSGLSNMADNLNSLVGQVQRTGIKVSSSLTELSATAKQQEVTLTHQVQSTHEVVKAVEEISDVAAKLVQTMQHVASMSQETAEFASSGQEDLGRMGEAMERMEEASKSISGRLETINEKAENITTVVTTITKVADQTNLLSLNAAIEAEKAGEYGRGFTVVAREIRRLADQTAVATLDIEQMVREMQSAVAAGVMEMDKFIAEVRHSAEDVEKISTQLARIIERVQTLSPRFEEVSVAMEEQSGRAQEINQDMMGLSSEMHQTTESLKESFFAMGQLSEAARDLQDEVSRFKLN